MTFLLHRIPRRPHVGIRPARSASAGRLVLHFQRDGHLDEVGSGGRANCWVYSFEQLGVPLLVVHERSVERVGGHRWTMDSEHKATHPLLPSHGG